MKAQTLLSQDSVARIIWHVSVRQDPPIVQCNEKLFAQEHSQHLFSYRRAKTKMNKWTAIKNIICKK